MATKYFVTRYFYPDESSGNSLLLSLVDKLSSNGFEDINVLTSNRISKSNTKLKKTAVKNNIKIRRLRALNPLIDKLYVRVFDYGIFLINTFFFTLFRIKKDSVMITMSDPPMLSSVLGLACYLRGIKQIQWLQDVYPEITRSVGINLPLFKSLKLLRNWSMKKAIANVVISNEMKKHFISEGINEEKITVIPNWTDEEEIYPIDIEKNKQYYNFASKDKFIIGYSGNFGVLHDFRILLESIKKVRSDNKIEFLFIGSGKRKIEIENFCIENKLENIQIFPFQKREILNQTLNIPDVHVVTLLENVSPFAYPSKIYGAMAAGKPIIFIGEKNCELFNFVESNAIGFSVENHDTKKLLDIILKLKNNDELRSEISRKTRKLFLSNYTFSISFDKWMKIVK